MRTRVIGIAKPNDLREMGWLSPLQIAVSQDHEELVIALLGKDALRKGHTSHPITDALGWHLCLRKHIISSFYLR